MPYSIIGRRPPRPGFTLIELLVVISIISLLISILMPSLSRARAQAKGVHCLARLKDMGNGIATYENIFTNLPPASWTPSHQDLPNDGADLEYGWAELLFAHLYGEDVKVAADFPVLRNVEGERFDNYFLCKQAGEEGQSSGHYRVYLPAWNGGGEVLDSEGRWSEANVELPWRSASRDRIRMRMPLIGDANELSERGDGIGDDDCSYIGAGEANYAGSNGRTNGNRFSDRHYGGTNYLFQDLHGEWNRRLRQDLSRDYDLNGVQDIDTPAPGGGLRQTHTARDR